MPTGWGLSCVRGGGPVQRRVKRSPGRAGAAWRKVSALVRARDLDCWLCLRPLRPHLRWPHEDSTSVHHVIPLAAGGPALDPRNLVAAHRVCNERAGARVLPRGALAEDRTRTRRFETSRDW